MKSLNAIARWVRIARAEDAGAAALELAVVLPVLVLLAIGVADYGRVFVTGMKVANAAMAGAQYGAQSVASAVDTTQIRQAATNDAGSPALVVMVPLPVCRCP